MFRQWMAAACLGVSLAPAQPPLTTIQDVLFKADGSKFNGLIRVTWVSFDGQGGANIAMQGRTVRIIDGNLYVELTPSTSANPAAYYNVIYNSDGKYQFQEYWSVPPSSIRLRVKDVRAAAPLWPGGEPVTASPNVNLLDVVGLQEALSVRAVKGPGFATGRSAVINGNGEIDGVIGPDSDCVRVDGTSAPCGTAGGVPFSFVDAEAPAGTIDAGNTGFTLMNAPNPPASLRLYRNGVLLRPGVDHTLSGSAITFFTAPKPGDSLLAFYRLANPSAIVPSFQDAETPAGTVDGSNRNFTLSLVPNPSTGVLLHRNGLLLTQEVDYTLMGQVIQFVEGAQPEPGDILQVSYRY